MSSEVKEIIIAWQHGDNTDKETLEDLIELLERSIPILIKRILNSTDNSVDSFLTDSQAIELIIKELNL